MMSRFRLRRKTTFRTVALCVMRTMGLYDAVRRRSGTGAAPAVPTPTPTPTSIPLEEQVRHNPRGAVATVVCVTTRGEPRGGLQGAGLT